jgi:hypothetical protein
MESRIMIRENKIPIICLAVLCIALAACSNRGSADNVTIEIGNSERFSTEEIDAAVDCVIRKFEDFEGCKLTELRYDEEYSNTRAAEEYAPGTAIVFLSEFDVGSEGGDGSLNPNSTYSQWQWILTREDASSEWQVEDWGY